MDEAHTLPEERLPPTGKRLAGLSFLALGVVYGDIGTSPLYAIRECFAEEYGVAVTPANVLGILSLVVWTLMLVVSVKYLSFILRADNHGEGGVIALTALLAGGDSGGRRRTVILLALGLFGASLLYGDGMITPAISVLSAVEGLEIAAPALARWVLPITVVILVCLFLVQRHGTARVGSVFAPITLVWFLVLAVLGVRGILKAPEVLTALNPIHAARFLIANRLMGFFTLGSVFLVVTGAETLYADLGHFGIRPIRLVWFVLVFPALVLNYFGQGATLLDHPEAIANPFYALAPNWAQYPLILLATAATIIASQAVISGAFSLTRQAVNLGYCPRVKIEHTSDEQIGQIYVPAVNWILMVSTIALVLTFRSSGRLAAAYGVAVTTTMIITTLLFYVVARERWQWSRLAAGIPTGIFLAVDLSFFLANIGKVAHGAWFPLAIGLAAFTILSTWKRGREVLGHWYQARNLSLEDLLKKVRKQKPAKVSGRAVYMTGTPDGVPAGMTLNLDHNHVLHEEVVFLTILVERVPQIARGGRVELLDLGRGFWRVIAHYGFQESPNVSRIMGQAKAKGLELSMKDTTFFVGRENVLPRNKSGISRWRASLFSFLSRNAQSATAYYKIPPEQVLELGAQIEV